MDEIAMCYISMDSSQRALQTNENIFFKFQINFRNFSRKQKFSAENRKIFSIYIYIASRKY